MLVLPLPMHATIGGTLVFYYHEPHRFDDIELSLVSSVVIAENRREAAERLAREREWDGMSADRVLEMPSIFIGSVDQIVDQMQVRRERYGISYHVVGNRSMEMVAPIVARLAGMSEVFHATGRRRSFDQPSVG